MIIPLRFPTIESFTDEELVAFCIANPDLSVEQDDANQLFIKLSHSNALISSNRSEIMGEIGIWNREWKLGKVLNSSCGYFLSDSSMRVCDVAWIELNRWNALSMAEKKSFPRLAPDFIIELQSETDSLSELKTKMQKWIDNGVRLAWLVSTEDQITYIYQQEKPLTTCSFNDILTGGGVLVDFSVRLSEILEY